VETGHSSESGRILTRIKSPLYTQARPSERSRQAEAAQLPIHLFVNLVFIKSSHMTDSQTVTWGLASHHLVRSTLSIHRHLQIESGPFEKLVSRLIPL